MSAVTVKVLLVMAAIVLVVLLARLAGRWQRPRHPDVDVSSIRTDAGIVLFTSTDCSTCAEARRVAEATDLAVREVTWELEPGAFSAVGVEAVPLTVLVGAGGFAVSVFAGVPRRGALRRALRRSGLAPRG